MKIPILIMLSLSLTILEAQDVTKELISKSDITWVAETKTFISFENEEEEDCFVSSYREGKEGNVVESYVLKYSEEVLYGKKVSEYFISNKINEILKNGSLKFLNESVEKNQTFHWYEVKLLWYYDSKENKMESLLKSIAPMVKKEEKLVNSKPDKDGVSPLIVIPMEQKKVTDLTINDAEVIWAKLSVMKPFDFSKAKVLKGNTKKTLKTVFHDNVKKGLYSICQPGAQHEPKVRKTFTDAEIQAASIDDLLNKNMGITEDKGVDFDNINLVGMEHKWYWDGNKNRLVCDLKSLSLYRSYYNKEGRLLFNVPVYFVDVK